MKAWAAFGCSTLWLFATGHWITGIVSLILTVILFLSVPLA